MWMVNLWIELDKFSLPHTQTFHIFNDNKTIVPTHVTPLEELQAATVVAKPLHIHLPC